MLTQKIYYADEVLSRLEGDEFTLISKAPWMKLYEQSTDKSLWRLDDWDKYQEQYFVRINDYTKWKEFDATDLQIELLKKTRGSTEKQCTWQACANKALSGLVFCEKHAYSEMGVRR